MAVQCSCLSGRQPFEVLSYIIFLDAGVLAAATTTTRNTSALCVILLGIVQLVQNPNDHPHGPLAARGSC